MIPARRIWITGIGTLAVATGLIGVLHMPFARGLLMDIGGCPVGHASLAEMEPARRDAIKTQLGTTPAPVRPALGFALDKTTREEARAWAERYHVSCKDPKEGLVSCADVPAEALGVGQADGPVGEVNFGFNTKGVLVDVSTMRTNVSPQPAIDVASKLAKEVGAPPQQHNGSFDDAKLTQPGKVALSSLRYSYSNYVAEVIAMRMPSSGLVVREHYMSAND